MNLYYIQHPLTEMNALSDEVCATFTDAQVDEYCALYDEYLVIQRKAASEGLDIANQLRGLVDKLFQDQTKPYDICKQTKYFKRMISSGETIVDVHSRRYPKPALVRHRVAEARERFPITQNQTSAHSQETLQEINNAVAFLLGKGMELNRDFTVSNALGVAKTVAETELAQQVLNKTAPVEGYNMILNGEVVAVQQAEGYNRCYYLTGGDSNRYPVYQLNISFQHGETPTVIL